MTMLAATRAALDATEAAIGEPKLLVEKAREGWFYPKLWTALSPAEQADATADTQQADHVIAGGYVWVRATGERGDAGKYGMRPDATPAENVTAFRAALARESEVVLPDGSCGLNEQVVSEKDGQVIRGRSIRSRVYATAAISGALLKLTKGRKQLVERLHIDANNFAEDAIELAFPQCGVDKAKITGGTRSGVRISHFSCWVGPECVIEYNRMGVYIADGVIDGQPTKVNNIRLGSATTHIQLNRQHGVCHETAGRDGLWATNLTLENNNTDAGAFADFAINSWMKGAYYAFNYHETDINAANFLFYRFTSSIEDVAIFATKMYAGGTTKPNHFISVAWSNGAIGNGYSFGSIWAAGFNTAMVNNRLGDYAQNELALRSNWVPSGSLVDSSIRVVYT